MVALLIHEDPLRAHAHAVSASRRAGRIPVARETLAMTAYRTHDFALALRELRTFRRISGRDDHVAIMVDAERGLGRPEKAVETGLAVDASRLDTEQRVHLAIAMSGARLDLGQTKQALLELEIPELSPKRAYSWSPDLFSAYATVLEDLDRQAEADEWYQHAVRAEAALLEHQAGFDSLEVLEILESEPREEDLADGEYTPDGRVERPDAEVEREAVPEGGAETGADQADSELGDEMTDELITVEDEVAQLLAEAGIVSDDAAPTDNAPPADQTE